MTHFDDCMSVLMIIFEEEKIVVTSLNQTYTGRNLDVWLRSSECAAVCHTQSCWNWRTDGESSYYCFVQTQKENRSWDRKKSITAN